MQDLQFFVESTLANQKPRLDPIPPPKPYEVYAYQSATAGAKDPFEPFFKEDDGNGSPAPPCPPEDCIKPPTHVPEELEQYPLDALRMVGTLVQEDSVWGIITSPEGTVHRVQVGNYLGQNYGKILSIQEEGISLMEILPDGRGGFYENETGIALAEE